MFLFSRTMTEICHHQNRTDAKASLYDTGFRYENIGLLHPYLKNLLLNWSCDKVGCHLWLRRNNVLPLFNVVVRKLAYR